MTATQWTLVTIASLCTLHCFGAVLQSIHEYFVGLSNARRTVAYHHDKIEEIEATLVRLTDDVRDMTPKQRSDFKRGR